MFGNRRNNKAVFHLWLWGSLCLRTLFILSLSVSLGIRCTCAGSRLPGEMDAFARTDWDGGRMRQHLNSLFIL